MQGNGSLCRFPLSTPHPFQTTYTDPEHSNAYSPEDLFCCEFAPYFMEGVKIRYPKYCRELPPVRKQAEPAR